MNKLVNIRVLSIVVLVLVTLIGAAAVRATSASPDKGMDDEVSALLIKDSHDDDDDKDKDDDDDSSGHGSGHDDDDDDHNGGGDVARPNIPTEELGVVVIEIIDERFVPARANVKAGERVTFINLDDDDHTATGIGFDTGRISPGSWKTVTLEKGGAAPFTCQYHPEMLGELTVEGGATPVASPVALNASPVSASVTVEILDYSFSSPDLEVQIGTEITWVNKGVAPHTVTGSFGDSGLILPGDSFSMVVTEPGTFTYVCQFHPEMTAQLTVG